MPITDAVSDLPEIDDPFPSWLDADLIADIRRREAESGNPPIHLDWFLDQMKLAKEQVEAMSDEEKREALRRGLKMARDEGYLD